MKIVHFAPFAPNACGLYEAARDMIVADLQAGHDSHLVDVGVTLNDGSHEEGKIGQTDARGGSIIQTESPEIVLNADIIMAHTGISDSWIVKCQTPIIWILHGRPTACFKPEQFGKGWSYTLISELAKWPRVKTMLSFWPNHKNFWEVIIPQEKIVCFNYPPIDENRFNRYGSMYDFAGKFGRYNIVISESLREDVDFFELIHGIILYAKKNPNFKVHIFGLENPIRCWELILEELRRLKILGTVWARRTNMEEVYRAADIIVSPQKIITRSIGEALSCGTPVIADEECSLATYKTKINNPNKVANILEKVFYDLTNKKSDVLKKVNNDAKKLSLNEYNKKINILYAKVLKTNKLVPRRQVPPKEDGVVSSSASTPLPELKMEVL